MIPRDYITEWRASARAQRHAKGDEHGPPHRWPHSAISSGFALPRDASRRLALRAGPASLHSHGN